MRKELQQAFDAFCSQYDQEHFALIRNSGDKWTILSAFFSFLTDSQTSSSSRRMSPPVGPLRSTANCLNT